jgi:PTH1 family peptidyl-tRNA hydrolase
MADDSDKALVVGLGNPGEKYRDTRHNIGFLVIDAWAERHRFAIQKATRLAELARGSVAGRETWLCKPMTYMNLSGQAVNWMRGSKSIAPVHIMCVLDDFALPLGKLRLRASGSAGGHNGLKSLNADLGTQEYPRLRIGIGPVPERWDPADFVLGRFTTDEKVALKTIVEQSCDCLDLWMTEGIGPAMNRFNTSK